MDEGGILDISLNILPLKCMLYKAICIQVIQI